MQNRNLIIIIEHSSLQILTPLHFQIHSPINIYHFYMLPNSLPCLCGFSRSVVAFLYRYKQQSFCLAEVHWLGGAHVHVSQFCQSLRLRKLLVKLNYFHLGDFVLRWIDHTLLVGPLEYIPTRNCVGIHPRRVEPASPIEQTTSRTQAPVTAPVPAHQGLSPSPFSVVRSRRLAVQSGAPGPP